MLLAVAWVGLVAALLCESFGKVGCSNLRVVLVGSREGLTVLMKGRVLLNRNTAYKQPLKDEDNLLKEALRSLLDRKLLNEYLKLKDAQPSLNQGHLANRKMPAEDNLFL